MGTVCRVVTEKVIHNNQLMLLRKYYTEILHVHGHGQTHSSNLCRFKLDI